MSYTVVITCENAIHAIFAQIQDKLHKIAQHSHDINSGLRHSVAYVDAVDCAFLWIPFVGLRSLQFNCFIPIADMQRLHRRQYVDANQSFAHANTWNEILWILFRFIWMWFDGRCFFGYSIRSFWSLGVFINFVVFTAHYNQQTHFNFANDFVRCTNHLLVQKKSFFRKIPLTKYSINTGQHVDRNVRVFNYCSATAIAQCDENDWYSICNHLALINVVPPNHKIVFHNLGGFLFEWISKRK